MARVGTCDAAAAQTRRAAGQRSAHALDDGDAEANEPEKMLRNATSKSGMHAKGCVWRGGNLRPTTETLAVL